MSIEGGPDLSGIPKPYYKTRNPHKPIVPESSRNIPEVQKQEKSLTKKNYPKPTIPDEDIDLP